MAYNPDQQQRRTRPVVNALSPAPTRKPAEMTIPRPPTSGQVISGAYQQAGGGATGVGAAARETANQYLVRGPLNVGNAVTNAYTSLYRPPLTAMQQFAEGALYGGPKKAGNQPVAAPAAPAAPAAAPAAARTFEDPVQAARTRAAMAQSGQPVQQPTLDSVQPGGGAIQALARPGQPVTMLSPQDATAMAGKINTVPAESFRRPMASTDQALSQARSAAMDRGDFEGVRRSYLSPEDRHAENLQIREKRALSGRRQKLESDASEPLNSSNRAKRRVARERLAALDASALQGASLQAQQAQDAFSNQIALGNMQANQLRASKSLERPNVIKTRKIFDQDGFQTGEEMVSFDPNTNTLTPLSTGQPNGADMMQQAQEAIAQGADPQAVMAELQRLQGMQ